MENVSYSSELPRDVTVTNDDDDEAFLGDMLSLSQFNVGCEIGKGQFSQVLQPPLIHVRHFLSCCIFPILYKQKRFTLPRFVHVPSVKSPLNVLNC